MFDIRKKDYLLLKEAIQNCRDFVFERNKSYAIIFEIKNEYLGWKSNTF